MNYISFSEKEFELIEKIRLTQIQEVWYNTINQFDFIINENDVISISLNSVSVKSINGTEEIINSEITQHKRMRNLEDYWIKVATDVKIEKVFLVQTAIEFSKLQPMGNSEKEKLSKSDDSFDQIMASAEYINECYYYNPKFIKLENENNELINLVDSGFLFKINGKYFSCFNIGNTYGYFFTEKEPFQEWLTYSHQDEFRTIEIENKRNNRIDS